MKLLQAIAGVVFGFILACALMLERAPAEPPKPVLRDAPVISILPGLEAHETAPVVDLVPAHEAKAEPAAGVSETSEAAQADSGVELSAPSTPPESVPQPVDVAKFVHPIMVNGQQGGCCVSTGPGAYVTAKHIFQDENGNYLSLRSVEIAGQLTNAHVNYPGTGDVATIRTDGNFKGAAVADSPVVEGDRVLVYGETTATVQHGCIVKDYVQIVETDPGVTQGDSGGGVFTEDGKLLGVISAFYGSRKSGTADQRRVYFASPPAGQSPSVATGFPRITIHTAPFHCPPCEAMKGYDWSGFDVTWETGGAKNYPEASWKDKRGWRRSTTGLHTPEQVRALYDRTTQ